MFTGKCAAALVTSVPAVPFVGGFKATLDQENVVGSRLGGKLVPDRELTTRLESKEKADAYIEPRLSQAFPAGRRTLTAASGAASNSTLVAL